MTAHDVMDARATLRASVLLHLQAGCTHSEALRRAMADRCATLDGGRPQLRRGGDWRH